MAIVPGDMPEIGRYLGIRVFIRYRDHPPPHFHVHYGGDSAIIAIETMQILEGRLPARVYGLITEWGMHHRGAVARKLAACHGPRTVALDSAAGGMRC